MAILITVEVVPDPEGRKIEPGTLAVGMMMDPKVVELMNSRANRKGLIAQFKDLMTQKFNKINRYVVKD